MSLALPGHSAETPGAGSRAQADGPDQHLALALEYAADDVAQTWRSIRASQAPLIDLGAHHVVLYTSSFGDNRVLVTIGVRNHASVREMLRSPAVFEWFDRIGVSDLPAIFVGEVLTKIDLEPTAPQRRGTGVVVGAVSTVDDPDELLQRVRVALPRFAGAGVRQVWLYRAVDDGREVMTLLEVDSTASAQRWADHPDAAAEWMSGVGIGGYPRLFVGRLAEVMELSVSAGNDRTVR